MYVLNDEYQYNCKVVITEENKAGLKVGDVFKAHADNKTGLVTFRAYGEVRSLYLDIPFIEVVYEHTTD